MPKNILLSFFTLMLVVALNVNLFSQQCEVSVANIDFESANSLTFDVLIENTGTSSFTYSHGSLAWTYDTAILNGGTASFSLVPGFSDFAASAFPPSALITSPNILRTSSNMPGSNGVIQAGESLRIYRFRLQTSAVSFSSDFFNVAWKNSVTPYTRIYSWDTGTGLPGEIQNLELSVQALLLVENFEFTGNLTDNGWTAHSGTGTNPINTTTGLIYANYPGSGLGNAALLDNTGEDVNRTFTEQTSGFVYYAFLTNVTTGTAGYFIHLGTGPSTFAARVFVQPSATPGKINFGISNSSTAVYGSTDFDPLTTYLMIVKYEVTNPTSNVSLWVKASGIPATEIAAGTPEVTTTLGTGLASIDGVYLRQYSSTQNMTVDGIRIATAWPELFPVSGTPLLNVSPSVLSGFSYFVGGGPSVSQSYNLSGSDLSPASGNITVTGSTNYEVSLNNSTFGASVNVPYSGGNLASTPIHIRLKAGLAGGTYNGELIANEGGGATAQNVTCNGSVVQPEPTNHVTNFAGIQGIPPYYNIDLSWMDAIGATLPDGYLIKGSTIDFSDITNPVDGTPELNSQLVQNVLQGVQNKTFILNSTTTYYFKIFPYTNSGSLINYKTDGTVPQLSIATATLPSLPITDNFEYATGSKLTDNGWVAHSGVGTNPIMVNGTSLSYTGYINSGIGKSVTMTTSGEDVNRAFNSDTIGTYYASFMVNIDSAKATGDYFFHLGVANTTSLFYGRVYVRKAMNDNLAFGLSKSSINVTTQPVYTDSIYSTGTTYLIVVSYEFSVGANNDTVKLWVNPVLNGIEPTPDLVHSQAISDAVNLGMFALRQGSSFNAAGLILGGLRVANTWVPESGSTTFQLSVNIANGWNMVSVPGLHPVDQNVNTWWAFRDMGANVFRYSGGYQSVTTAAPGIGYWMKHAGARTYNTGDEWPAGGINVVPHTPLTAASGWNLFGGYELIVTAANVTTNPPGLQSGPIYKYAGGYSVATTLDPGYGYWIKLTGAGQIIIPETLAKGEEPVEYFPENWGKIVLTDATGINYTLYAVKGEVNLDNYELPPAPMTGMFDIRYSSGRIAEDINSSLKTIDMNGVTYPLTVRVEGMDMRLMDETGKTVNVNLKSGEDVVISDATIQKLMVSGELVPAAYALEQNYPNPFNPSTVIEFSLPENVGNVKLSIYNMLGEKVAELVNTALVAGKYSYQWNAQNVATGMYIYELRTDNFVSIKKMLLIK